MLAPLDARPLSGPLADIVALGAVLVVAAVLIRDTRGNWKSAPGHPSGTDEGQLGARRKTARTLVPDQELRGGGNFTLLRVIASLLVVVAHSYALTGAVYDDPLLRLTHRHLGSGSLAVISFFVISGFLVMNSWQADPRLGAYMVKRALRILPGLFAAILVVALVAGPLVSEFSIRDYFHSPLLGQYVWGDLAVFRATIELPGVFIHNPYPNAANGSIWTIRYEIVMYALVPIVGFLCAKSRSYLPALAAFVVVFFPWQQVFLTLPVLLLPTDQVLDLARFFFAGVVLLRLGRRLPRRWYLSLGLLALLVVSWKFASLWWVGYIVIPYEVIYLAYLDVGPLANFGRRHDLSYGIYLYAFPIQQTIIRMSGGRISALGVLGLTLPCVLAAAFLSWHLVEAPAIRLKKRFGRARSARIAARTPVAVEPVAQPAESG